MFCIQCKKKKFCDIVAIIAMEIEHRVRDTKTTRFINHLFYFFKKNLLHPFTSIRDINGTSVGNNVGLSLERQLISDIDNILKAFGRFNNNFDCCRIFWLPLSQNIIFIYYLPIKVMFWEIVILFDKNNRRYSLFDFCVCSIVLSFRKAFGLDVIAVIIATSSFLIIINLKIDPSLRIYYKNIDSS